jgi:hypothetical protein
VIAKIFNFIYNIFRFYLITKMLFQSCLFVLTTFCLTIVSGQAPSNQQEKGQNPGGEDQQQAKVDDLNAINCSPSTQESVAQRRCCLKHPFAGQDWNGP